MLEALFKQKAAPSAIAKLSEPDPVPEVVPVAPPPKVARPQAKLHTLTQDDAKLREYAEVAASVGIATPAVEIENFRRFLTDRDLPIFSLTQVVAYMDDKAERESAEKAGWLWRPLRAKDKMANTRFGTLASRSAFDGTMTKGSDGYVGPHDRQWLSGSNGVMQTWRDEGTPAYDMIVPLHALRKVALIEREYKAPVSFFVCDYAPAPAFAADPFLMAVVPNPFVGRGDGRFVIDFWDEPGFGLERQLNESA